MPLSVKLLIFTLGIALVPLFISAYISQRTALDIMLEHEREDIYTHADEVSSSIDRILRMRLAEVSGLAEEHYISAVIQNSDELYLETARTEMEEFATRHGNIASLFLMDSKGNVFLTSSHNLGKNFGNRPFFLVARAGQSYASEPSRDNGQDLIYYSAPVRNGDGSVGAVLVMMVDAREIWEIIRREANHVGQGSVAILTDENGVRIAHSSDDSLVYTSWFPLAGETEAALVNQQRYGEDITSIGFTDYPDIWAILSLDDPPQNIIDHKLAISEDLYESGVAREQIKPWTVLESVPHSSFLEPVSVLRRWMATIMGGAAAAIFLLTLVVSYLSVKPIRSLMTSVQHMSDGDMNTPVPALPDREMNVLANEFENMRRKVSGSYDDLQQGYLEMAKALVAGLEARDQYTAGHTERVGQYAVSLARKLDLTDEEVDIIKKAADLHDIGKIGVPDEVLLKPDRLTPNEFAQIKRHPVKSSEIVHFLGFLRAAIPGIEGHHERYDGGGYPSGLKGENIPLEARILAIADAYDAMTSSRAYREAMSHDKAVMILREGAGTQWDPVLVQAFLEMLEEQRPSTEAHGAQGL